MTTKQDKFHYAIQTNDITTVEILLKDPHVDPNDQNNFSIRSAAYYGHTSIVELLLKDHRVDLRIFNNWPLQLAIQDGYISIVELLLKDSRVDPSDNNNYAISNAVIYNQISIVKLLLKDPRVDPNIIQCTKNKSIMKLLLEDHRTILNKTLKNLSEDYLTPLVKQRLLTDDSNGWWVIHVNKYRDNFILVVDLLSTFIHRDIIECIFAEYICNGIRKQLIKRRK